MPAELNELVKALKDRIVNEREKDASAGDAQAYSGGVNTLDKAKSAVAVTEVVRYGEQLTIPVGMSLKQAKDLIDRREKYEEMEVTVAERFPVFPWDGAAALQRVLTRKYGWAQGIPTPGFFGDAPPAMIAVETGVNETVQVPWGRFALPNVQGYIETGYTKDKGLLVFSLNAEVKRKHEAQIKALYDEVRQEVTLHSLYKGKALKARFINDRGQAMAIPEITFMDVNIDPSQAIYSRHTEAQLERDLFGPIRRVHDLILNGIAVKRGVLLTGTFGTGKTLAANVAAKYATDSGLLYLYVPTAAELQNAISFARQYQSPAAVVFVEDIDRVTSGARTAEVDEILNIIDGIDGKNSNIIVVLTTNNIDAINPAMIRPGRLDSIIDVTTPDAQAAERLVRRYAGHSVPAGEDLTEVGQRLSGQIPAVIVEVVKRAKLAELVRQPTGTVVTSLSAQALLDAADTMQTQIKILERAQTKKTVTNAQVFTELFSGLALGHMEKDELYHLPEGVKDGNE